MMQLVAMIEDGHTSLEPTGLAAFDRWFPLRFYRFTDGIFITAASDAHASIIGSRVLRIGQLNAEEAWRRAGSLLGADNRFGTAERAPFHLANAAALAGLASIPIPPRSLSSSTTARAPRCASRSNRSRLSTTSPSGSGARSGDRPPTR